MDRYQIEKVIAKKLNLPDEEFEKIRNNSKLQKLFESAIKASRYRLVAEVVESKGCHSGHEVGPLIFFYSSGNLLTNNAPEGVCTFLMPNLTVLINAFFENLMNGRDPNEVMFNRTGCFDVGPLGGGLGHVVVEMKAEDRGQFDPRFLKV